jgi:uncharacterized SAM-binding protein YcdF (DUF218 family)
MFFILSKTMNFLAMPLTFICLAFLLSLIIEKPKWKRGLLLSSFIALLFFSNDFIANEAMTAWELPVTPFDEIKRSYAYGILLTGVTHNDRDPTDRVYFTHGADRVVHTAELYKRGIIKKILVTGGTGRLITEGRPEADELVKVLELMGIPKTDILIENESRNTYESAIRVREILQDAESEKLMLITSAFHLRRTRACFKKVGLDADTFSTDFYTHPTQFTPGSLFVPNPDALVIWHKLFKEWLGISAYWVAGYI